MRNTFLFILLAVCISCQPQNSPQEVQNSEETETIFYDNITIRRDVVYAREDTTQQVMDMYLQGNSIGETTWFEMDQDAKPTLIYIHGGGWLGGDKAGNPYIFTEYLKRGFNVFSLNYRMGPGTAPDAVEDVICALRWLVDRKDSFMIDDQRIYVSGASAGGHLSLMTGFAPTSNQQFKCDVADVRIKGVINFFGITEIKDNEAFLESTRPDWNYTIAWIGERDRVDQISGKYSPVYNATTSSPDVITIHGALDSIVPYQQAVLLHKKLVELELRNKLVTIPEGNHGGFGNNEYERAYDEVFAFLGTE